MPKNRKRATEKGAKSIAILTKHKIGGRKSNQGTNKLSNNELTVLIGKIRKRDKNKLFRALEFRGLTE